jgi:hypothetical protein
MDRLGGTWGRSSVWSACGRRRLSATVPAAAALLLVALAAPASAQSRQPRLRILLPAPGHITLESISATKGHPSARQRRLGLLRPSFPSAGTLPPSVRILFLRRTFRTQSSVKTVVLFLVINRAPPKGAAFAFAAGDEPNPLPPPDRYSNDNYVVAGLAALASPPSTYDFSYRDAKVQDGQISARAARNADLAQGSQMKSAESVLDDLFTGHAGSPATPPDVGQTLSDPNLDTGHYDDGHAFGWKVKTSGQQKDVWTTLSTDFVDQKPAQALDGIENIAHTDLNADGKIGTGSGSGPGGGGSCSGTGTTGSQTLTDPSPQAQVAVYDFTTSIPATCDITADTNVAIYLISDSDGSVIACRQAADAPNPPGQSACPRGEVNGPLPGDPSSTVTMSNATRAQGATVWHVPISVEYGVGGGQASAHLVYRWVPLP